MSSHPDLQSAIDLTLLHQVSPLHAAFSVIISFHKLCEVQPDVSKYDCFPSSARRVLLQDLELYVQVLQHAITVYYQPKRQCLFIVPYNFVLSDDDVCGSSAMLRFIRAMYVPFDKRSSGDQRNIVKVNYLVLFQQM